MLKLTKFVFGCFGLGVAVLLAAGYVNPTAAGRVVRTFGADTMIQSVATETSSLFKGGSIEVPASMRGFSATAGAFVDSNLITAQLQLKGMQSSIAAHVSGFGWLRPKSTNLQQAAQDATIGTRNLARKMPAVNALRSNRDNLSSLHPTLSSADIGF